MELEFHILFLASPLLVQWVCSALDIFYCSQVSHGQPWMILSWESYPLYDWEIQCSQYEWNNSMDHTEKWRNNDFTDIESWSSKWSKSTNIDKCEYFVWYWDGHLTDKRQTVMFTTIMIKKLQNTNEVIRLFVEHKEKVMHAIDCLHDSLNSTHW